MTTNKVYFFDDFPFTIMTVSKYAKKNNVEKRFDYFGTGHLRRYFTKDDYETIIKDHNNRILTKSKRNRGLNHSWKDYSCACGVEKVKQPCAYFHKRNKTECKKCILVRERTARNEKLQKAKDARSVEKHKREEAERLKNIPVSQRIAEHFKAQQ